MRQTAVDQTVIDERTYLVPYLADWLRVGEMRQVDAARYAGIAPQWLCRISKGTQRFRGDRIRAIAEALGIPPSVLVFCSPFYDERGKPWARKIAVAATMRRLTPTG